MKRYAMMALPAAVGLFAFLMYANTLGHLYSLDDNLVIYGNRYVNQGAAGIGDIFTTPFTHGISRINDNGYRPVPIMTYALEKELFGKNAFFPQHLVHVSLFAVSAALLFMLLRRLLRDRGSGPAVVAALLFAAHPVHTEVVANLKSRDEILSLLFGLLLTTWTLFRFVDTEKRRYQILSILSFAVGIFSKESAVTYLLIIPLTLHCFTDRPIRRVLLLSLPYVAVAGIYLGIRGYVLAQFPDETYDFLQNTLIGARTWDERHATAMLVMGRYAELLLVPHPLVWDYSFNQIPLVRWFDPRVILSVLIHLGLLGIALWKLRQRSVFAYCLLFYLVTISINSNLFVMTPSILGERFLFTPSIGFCVAAALVICGAGRRLAGAGKPLAATAAVTAVVLALCGAKTFHRNRDWKDSLTISLADVKTSPESIRVQSTLAAVYLTMARKEDDPAVKRGLYSRTIPVARKILKLYPQHKEAWYNIGICYYFLGELDRSEHAFREHLRLHPGDARTYNNLGGLYYFRRDYNKALTYFERFVAANPRDARAVNNLGVINLHNLRRPGRAIKHFEKAISLAPRYPVPHKKLGDAYLFLRQPARAIKHYERALALDPAGMGRLRGHIDALKKQFGLR